MTITILGREKEFAKPVRTGLKVAEGAREEGRFYRAVGMKITLSPLMGEGWACPELSRRNGGDTPLLSPLQQGARRLFSSFKGAGTTSMAVPASEDAAVLTPPNVEVHQTESMSNIRLLLSLIANVAIGLYLLARSLDDWLSGPPMTEKERTRLSITAADRHWWYWSRL